MSVVDLFEDGRWHVDGLFVKVAMADRGSITANHFDHVHVAIRA